VSFGVAMLFPFAGEFLPGAPGDHGLTLIAVAWSVLALVVAGVADPGTPFAQARKTEVEFALAPGSAGLGSASRSAETRAHVVHHRRRLGRNCPLARP